MEQFKNTHLLSILTLVVLSIFGTHFLAFSISGIRMYLFVVYFIIFQIPLTILLLGHYRQKILIFNCDIYLSLLLIYIFVSTLWLVGDTIFIGHLGILTISIGIGLIISVTATRRIDQYMILNTLKMFAVLMLLIGIVTAMVDMTFLEMEWFADETFYSVGWYGYQNTLSYFLSITSAFFLATAFHPGYSFLRRTTELATFIMMSTIIIINDSRAALGAQIIIIGAITVLTYATNRERHALPGFLRWIVVSKRKFTLGTILLLPTFFFMFVMLPNPFVDGSLHIRWNLHAGAFQLALENPLGVGISNYQLAITELDTYNGQTRPHSWFAHIIGEFGFVGTLLFLLLYGAVLDILFNNALSSGNPLLIALFASLASFSVSGLSPANPLLFQIHWILFGLAFAVVKSCPVENK